MFNSDRSGYRPAPVHQKQLDRCDSAPNGSLLSFTGCSNITHAHVHTAQNHQLVSRGPPGETQNCLLHLQDPSLVHRSNDQATTTHRNSQSVCTCDTQPERSLHKKLAVRTAVRLVQSVPGNTPTATNRSSRGSKSEGCSSQTPTLTSDPDPAPGPTHHLPA